MKKVALLLGVTGAIMLALNVGLNLPAFCIMLVQSLYWVKAMWKTEREAAMLNATFALINVVGIVRALI